MSSIHFHFQLDEQERRSFTAYRLRLPENDVPFERLPVAVDSISLSCKDGFFKNRFGDGRRFRSNLGSFKEWGLEEDEVEPLYAKACGPDGSRFYVRLMPHAQHATQDDSLQTFQMYKKILRDARFHSNHLLGAAGRIVPHHYGLWYMETGDFAGTVFFSLAQWCGIPFANITFRKLDTEALRILVGRTFEALHDYGVIHSGQALDCHLFDKAMIDTDDPTLRGNALRSPDLRCYIIDFSEATPNHKCARKVPVLPLGSRIRARDTGCLEIGYILVLLGFTKPSNDVNHEPSLQSAVEWHTRYHKRHPGVENSLAMIAQREKLYANWPKLYPSRSYHVINPDDQYPKVELVEQPRPRAKVQVAKRPARRRLRSSSENTSE